MERMATPPPGTEETAVARESLSQRLVRVTLSELSGLRPGLRLVQLAVRLIPGAAFGRLRAAGYRLGGLRIGRRTRLLGRLEIEGTGDIAPNLRVGDDCLLNSERWSPRVPWSRGTFPRTRSWPACPPA
jgi:hypothetical protein